MTTKGCTLLWVIGRRKSLSKHPERQRAGITLSDNCGLAENCGNSSDRGPWERLNRSHFPGPIPAWRINEMTSARKPRINPDDPNLHYLKGSESKTLLV
jgi:hypothetical protein